MSAICSNRVCENQTTAEGTPLQVCMRCQTTAYCSRECQAENWPTHKGLCPGSRRGVSNPGLFDKQDADSYGVIIDTFRLRCEDDYSHGGHNHGIYSGESNPLPVFLDYLNRAETAELMPSWWNASKRAECTRIAGDENNQLCINFAQEKGDIQETYNDDGMPMKMRMMAESIYGGGYGMGQAQMPRGFQCFCQS